MNDTTITAPALDMALVEKAAAERIAAAERLEKANAELKAAEHAARVATAAAAAAVGDPLALAKPERDANDTLLMAQRVAAICAEQLAAATKAQADAYAEAHRPVHDAGVAIRLAACKRADAAKAELAAAEAEFRRGSALVARAREKGCKASAGMEGGTIATPVHSAAYEAAIWGISA